MVATKEEFIQALLKVRDKGKLRNTRYLDLIRAQYLAENHTITATRLAEAVGFENFNAANLHYGKFAHEVADALSYKPPLWRDKEPMWFWTLSSGKEASADTLDGHYEFIMRPELVSALEEMNWVKA
jgi:hypothetical protein